MLFLSSRDYIEIKDLLYEHKQIEVVDHCISRSSSTNILLFGKDLKKEYTIIVFVIHDDQNLETSTLAKAKEKSALLQECVQPNIVQYLDHFTLNKYYFILLEKYEKSLQQLVEENHYQEISIPLFVNVASQLFNSLEYLHSKGLFLQDFSLKSILVDRDSNLNFIDFVRADKDQETNQQFCEIEYYEFERIQFISPENIKDNRYNHDVIRRINYSEKSDVWSICMCLYIFIGASQKQATQLFLGQEPYRNQTKVNYKVNQIISNALQRDPKLRPSVQDFIQQLKQLSEQPTQMDAQINADEQIKIFEEAQQLFEKQSYKEAIVQFKRLVQINPDSDKYLAWIGRAYSADFQCDEAEYWSNQALNINPQNDMAYFNLGNVTKMRKNSKEALNFFLQSLSYNPKNIFSLNNLGLLYDQEGMEDKAQELYLKAIDIESKQFLCYNLGRSLYLQKKNDQAAKWFEESLKLDPKYFKAYTYLGEIALDQNQPEDALKYFKKSLEINPNFESSLFSLGTLYYLKKQYALSLLYFQQAETQLKTNSLYYILASSFYCKKRYDKAIQNYSKALRIQPDDQNSLLYLRCSKKYI